MGEIEIRSFNNDKQFLKHKYENENEYENEYIIN